MSRRMMILVALVLAGSGGCTGEYRGTVVASSSMPDLVYAAPGVSVIADYEEPIFYSNGFYWWNYGGYWYRSRYYTGGWTYASPPRTIARIHDPYRYRRYRPSGYVVKRRPVPSHRIERPSLRDRRARR